MKEAVFIRENEAKWKEIEGYIQQNIDLSPDALAENYIRLTDDLAYARSMYEFSKLPQYLNELAFQLHQQIYKNKRKEASRIPNFWKYEVPLTFAQSFKELRISALIFIISILIGMFSASQDIQYVTSILGEQYINITEANIDKGDPMAIYKSQDAGMMFFGIGSNNIWVSLLTYVAGIFSAFATGIILMTNGTMVGAFQYYFISKGLGWISFSTIFIHGALELSCIVFAGAAGIVLGNSWIFPGTYHRLDALLIGAKKSLKIMIGIIPVIVMAAFLESFVTRSYLELGSVTRLIIILLSYAFIIWYFILYPLRLTKSVNP